MTDPPDRSSGEPMHGRRRRRPGPRSAARAPRRPRTARPRAASSRCQCERSPARQQVQDRAARRALRRCVRRRAPRLGVPAALRVRRASGAPTRSAGRRSSPERAGSCDRRRRGGSRDACRTPRPAGVTSAVGQPVEPVRSTSSRQVAPAVEGRRCGRDDITGCRRGHSRRPIDRRYRASRDRDQDR